METTAVIIQGLDFRASTSPPRLIRNVLSMVPLHCWGDILLGGLGSFLLLGGGNGSFGPKVCPLVS